jgi:hypothetical protein
MLSSAVVLDISAGGKKERYSLLQVDASLLKGELYYLSSTACCG